MKRGVRRGPGGLRAWWLTAALFGASVSSPAAAASPEGFAPTPEGPRTTKARSGSELLALETPALVAYTPEPASFAPPEHAKSGKERTFETKFGETDPRKKQLPRTHRFRLTLHAQWIRLSQTLNPATGEFERFHYAPIMLDLGYQAQFLKYVMVRIAVAVGGNPANTRNAMPIGVFPQAYVGFQHKTFGAALGYGFDWTIPPSFGAMGGGTNALEQPVITRNHVVTGELSLTSRIDRVAMTFSFSVGGIQSDLSHYSTVNRKWRPYIGFQAGGFFDGSKRREKKAKKAAEAGASRR